MTGTSSAKGSDSDALICKHDPDPSIFQSTQSLFGSQGWIGCPLEARQSIRLLILQQLVNGIGQSKTMLRTSARNCEVNSNCEPENMLHWSIYSHSAILALINLLFEFRTRSEKENNS
jgi:hypothetical protein